MVADHEQLYVFGGLQASEVFQDQGATNPLVPFAPNPGAIMHYGCVAPWSVCRLDEGLAWIGGDVERGDRVAFMEIGFRPRKISTAAVETAWASYATVDDAVAYTSIDRGHQFWCINFPTGNATWVYDLTTGMWYERGTDVTGVQRIYWNRCGKGRDRIWQLVSWQTASTGVTLELSWSDTRARSWLTRSTQTLATGVDVTLANVYLQAIQGSA